MTKKSREGMTRKMISFQNMDRFIKHAKRKFKLIVIYFQSLISALNHTLNLRYACGSPFVIVISIFLQCPQKRSRGNQLIHIHLTRTISIGSWSRSRESGRQAEGYGGMCMELRRGGRHGERG